MKKSELRQIIKEAIQQSRPQVAPERQSPERETIVKPDVDAPPKPRRRTLTPPIEAPVTKPKAESVDKDLANKMADRFQKLK